MRPCSRAHIPGLRPSSPCLAAPRYNARPMTGVEQILSRHAAVVDTYLEKALSGLREAPPRLLESIRYSLTAGGKRLRPALVLESCRACGVDEFESGALPAAAAIELIHT